MKKPKTPPMFNLGFKATKGDQVIRHNTALYHIGVYVAIYLSGHSQPIQLMWKDWRSSNRNTAAAAKKLIADGYTIEEYGEKEVTKEILEYQP